MRARRPSLLFVAAGALVIPMVLLAILQVHWLTDLRRGDRARQEIDLRNGARSLAESFDDEIRRAYLAFQIDADDLLARDWTQFALQHDRWRSEARHPQLVREVWLAARDLRSAGPSANECAAAHFGLSPAVNEKPRVAPPPPNEGEIPSFNPCTPWTIERWDVSARRFLAIPASAARDALQKELTSSGRSFAFAPRRQTLRPVHEEPLSIRVPALLQRTPAAPMPFAQGLEESRMLAPELGFTVVVLGRDYVVRELLPELARTHLPAETWRGEPAYAMTIVSRGNPDRVIYSSLKEPPRAAPEASVAMLGVAFTVERNGVRVEESTGPAAVSKNVFAFGEDPAESLPAEGNPVELRAVSPAWQLLVHHRAGSLDLAVAEARYRKLAITAVAFVLLGVCATWLFVAAQRAQRAARRQLELVRGITHDLKTPVSVLYVTSASLADGRVRDQERVQKYGRMIQTAGRRLSDIVDQILNLARAQTDPSRVAHELVDAGVLIDEALGALLPEMEEKGFRWEIEIERPLPRVRVDANGIIRALQNLLANAIKYSGDSRRIGVHAAAAGSEIHITVEDDGIGIAANELAEVFEPFRRGGNAVGIAGNGLGLSVVEEIVRANGGRVTVRSAQGEGSAFTLHLAAEVEEHEKARAAG